MNVASCDHVSSIEFYEFCGKNGPYWPISDEVVPQAGQQKGVINLFRRNRFTS